MRIINALTAIIGILAFSAIMVATVKYTERLKEAEAKAAARPSAAPVRPPLHPNPDAAAPTRRQPLDKEPEP